MDWGGNIFGSGYWPTNGGQGLTSAIVSGSITTNTRFITYVFQAERTDTIKALGFHIQTAPSQADITHTISLQGVNSLGSNSGTVLASGNAYNTFTTNTNMANQFFWFDLVEPVSVNTGDLLSIVVEPNPVGGAYPNATNRMISIVGLTGLPTSSFPIGKVWSSVGSIATSTSNSYPIYGYKSDTTVYGNLGYQNSNTLYDAFTTNEVGFRFTLPEEANCYLTGASLNIGTANVDITMNVSLYDSKNVKTSLLTNFPHFGFHRSTANRRMHFEFPDTHLLGGETYRLVMEVPDTADLRLAYFGYESDVTKQPFNRYNFILTYRDPQQGGWIEDPLVQVKASLILNGFKLASSYLQLSPAGVY